MVESQDNLGWKGTLELSGPFSGANQEQLWGQTPDLQSMTGLTKVCLTIMGTFISTIKLLPCPKGSSCLQTYFQEGI